MPERIIEVPDPDHPSTVEPNFKRVTVMLNGAVVADTTEAPKLREAAYPPVHYIPLKDVDMAALVR